MTPKSMFFCAVTSLVLVGLAWGSRESQKASLMTKWGQGVRLRGSNCIGTPAEYPWARTCCAFSDRDGNYAV